MLRLGMGLVGVRVWLWEQGWQLSAAVSLLPGALQAGWSRGGSAVRAGGGGNERGNHNCK